MQTAIEFPDNTRVIHITQQYTVGLYIAIYDADDQWRIVGIPDQGSSQKTEARYHKDLRKEITADTSGVKLNEERSTPL